MSTFLVHVISTQKLILDAESAEAAEKKVIHDFASFSRPITAEVHRQLQSDACIQFCFRNGAEFLYPSEQRSYYERMADSQKVKNSPC